jgi:hypothetical protein
MMQFLFYLITFKFLILLALPLFGKQSERYYQEKFAQEIGGQVEVVMKDGTRCDILTPTHAIEVDFAKKWAEAIGQSLNYAMHTGKRPAVALIVLSLSDNKYIERVRNISAEYSLGLTIYPIDGGGASKSVPKDGGKEFWITSSGRTHNKNCVHFGTTKTGKYSDNPSGVNCKTCGGG